MPYPQETQQINHQDFVSLAFDYKQDTVESIDNNFERACNFFELHNYDFNNLDTPVKKALQVLLNIHINDIENSTEKNTDTYILKREKLRINAKYSYPYVIEYKLLDKINNNQEVVKKILQESFILKQNLESNNSDQHFKSFFEQQESVFKSNFNKRTYRPRYSVEPIPNKYYYLEDEKFIGVLKPQAVYKKNYFEKYNVARKDYLFLLKKDLEILEQKTNKELFHSYFYPEIHEFLELYRVSLAHSTGMPRLAKICNFYPLIMPQLFDIRDNKIVQLIDPKKIEVVELPVSTYAISDDGTRIILFAPTEKSLEKNKAYICLNLFNGLEFKYDPTKISIYCYQYNNKNTYPSYTVNTVNKQSQVKNYFVYDFNIISNYNINSDTFRDYTRTNYAEGLESFVLDTDQNSYITHVNAHRLDLKSRAEKRITDYAIKYKIALAKKHKIFNFSINN